MRMLGEIPLVILIQMVWIVGPQMDLLLAMFPAGLRLVFPVHPIGRTSSYPPNTSSRDTHTYYPNCSNYMRLNPVGGHGGSNKNAHGHGHAKGLPGKVGREVHWTFLGTQYHGTPMLLIGP